MTASVLPLGPRGSAAAGGGGFGLFSIGERLRPLGGDLKLESGAGGGTSVTLDLAHCISPPLQKRAYERQDPRGG